MIDEHGLNKLIGQTYDAAIGDEDWAALLERLKRMLGGTAAVLRWVGRPAAQATRIDMNPAFDQLYVEHYQRVDPIMPVIRRLPPGSVATDRMLMPGGALERTEIYNDLLLPNDLPTSITWFGLDTATQPVVLKIVRSRRRPLFADEELRLLRFLAPHVARAVQIEGRLATAEGRRTAVQLSRQGPGLSPRERDCLAHIARGASSKGIARQLALSVHTVNQYIGSAMRKLQASSRSEAVAMALVLGLLNL